MRTLFFSISLLVACISANVTYAQFSFLVQSGSSKQTADEKALATGKGTQAQVAPIVGAFTFPFKYRPQTGIFEPSLSLSGAIGVSIPFKKSGGNASIAFLGSFGPSSITLSKNNSTDTGTTTRSSATSAFTVLGQWNKIQIAVSVGIDDNLDNSTDKWIYQSKPWVSFGFGYSIFTSN